MLNYWEEPCGLCFPSGNLEFGTCLAEGAFVDLPLLKDLGL